MRQLQLHVDPIACDGHGLCADLLPERIELDEWGYPVIDRTPVHGITRGARPTRGCRMPQARSAAGAVPMITLAADRHRRRPHPRREHGRRGQPPADRCARCGVAGAARDRGRDDPVPGAAGGRARGRGARADPDRAAQARHHLLPVRPLLHRQPDVPASRPSPSGDCESPGRSWSLTSVALFASGVALAIVGRNSRPCTRCTSSASSSGSGR